jgi:hypothetical protein
MLPLLSNKPLIRFPVILFFFLLCSIFPFYDASAEFKETIHDKGLSGVDFQNSLLKISVEKKPFHEIINTISQKTGIKFITSNISDKEITISFDYLPLEKGLQNLLAGRSYILFYQSQETPLPAKLTKVLILPNSEGKTVVAHSNAGWKNPDKTTKQKNVPIDQKKLNELLKNSPQSNEDMQEKFIEALQGIQGTDGFKELEQSGDNTPQTDITKALNDVLTEKNTKNLNKVIEEIIQKKADISHEGK